MRRQTDLVEGGTGHRDARPKTPESLYFQLIFAVFRPLSQQTFATASRGSRHARLVNRESASPPPVHRDCACCLPGLSGLGEPVGIRTRDLLIKSFRFLAQRAHPCPVRIEGALRAVLKRLWQHLQYRATAAVPVADTDWSYSFRDILRGRRGAERE